MRRIVRAETTALETEIAVRSFRRRNGPRELGDRDRMLFVANVDYPVGKENLVAVGVGGFAVGEHKSAVENSAINGVKGDAHTGILGWRFKSSHLALLF